ncbi:hypothetical protein [uncultured Duncaniella sp.]|uniref:hypothetical protein n=2 Tax=uncultured Duncaniella sp. TaxID=2768039 RepID=UPI00260FDB2B|nr:hypothetical protein [uncultured Duncaniella sp.]
MEKTADMTNKGNVMNSPVTMMALMTVASSLVIHFSTKNGADAGFATVDFIAMLINLATVIAWPIWIIYVKAKGLSVRTMSEKGARLVALIGGCMLLVLWPILKFSDFTGWWTVALAVIVWLASLIIVVKDNNA